MKKKLFSLFVLFVSLHYSSFAQSYDIARSFGISCGRTESPPSGSGIQTDLIDMVVLPDGKILLLGSNYDINLNNFTITMTRLDECGMPDSSFGINGISQQTFSQRNDAHSFKVDSIGRIYCVGYESPNNSLSDFRAYIARFNSDGSPDTTFGDNGRVVEYNSAIPLSSSCYTGLVLQPDGKAVAWGTEGVNVVGSGNSCISRRYDSNGDLDLTYNPAVNYPSISTLNQDFGLNRTSGFLQADGSIYFNYIDRNNSMVLVKLTSAGALDTSFHTTGFSVLPFTINGTWPSITQLPNGYWRGVLSSQTFANVFQLDPNGDPDSTFGVNGLLELPHIPGTNNNEVGNDLLIDSQGKTWIFGSASGPFGVPYWVIWRLTPSFGIDSTFEGTGYKYFYPSLYGPFKKAKFLQDERMLVGGNNYGCQVATVDRKDKVLSIEQGSTIEFCDSSSVTINATCSGSTVSCYTYQWYRNGSPIGTNSSDLVITQAGSYYLLASYSGGTDTSEVITASLIVNPLPAIFQSNDTLYSTYSGAGLSWQWALEGVDIPGATNPIYVTNVQGNYSVIVTDSNTCTSTSLPFFAVGVNNRIDQSSFVIFPNPASDEINLRFTDPALSVIQFQLIDISGKIVVQRKLEIKNTGATFSIPVKNISSGYYFARLSTTKNTTTQKIIINH